MLAELLADPFFAQPPPKSTGRERFGDGYAAALHARVPGADGVATAVELTARTVPAAVAGWTPRGTEVVASGGGCHHPGLMAALERHLQAAGGHALRRFDELFFPGDAKEAVAFALLGYLTLHGQPGNLPAATGAGGSRVLGRSLPHEHPARGARSRPARPARAPRGAPMAGSHHEAARIADALDLGVGGFIVFGGTVEAVRRLTADLLRRAGRPLLIAADLERGAGQQVEGLTEFPPPLALASLEDAAVVRWAGAVTAQEARAVGINWIFAPVGDLDVLPDNPIVQTRAFGGDPNRVASLRPHLDRGLPGRGRARLRQAFPRARPHHRRFPHRAAGGGRRRATRCARPTCCRSRWRWRAGSLRS